MSDNSHLHTSFLQKNFEKEAKERTDNDPLQALICDEFVAVCKDFDQTQIQESWSWRNTHLARELAKSLIDEKGELNKRKLSKAIELLEENLYSLGGGRYHDGARQQHLVFILKLFQDDTAFQAALRRINKPHGHQIAERLIRETLFLSEGGQIKDFHARQAAFSALLTSLRQNVGSCFATAPAILIQQEQPLQFLTDISQLFGTGRLSRVLEGVEYTVPLSPSWGMGDLLRPIQLYTLGKEPVRTLASSPGLQAAFQAAGLIEKHKGAPECTEACLALLKGTGISAQEGDPFLILLPEQILKHVLLSSFGVTEKDVAQYRERNIQGPLAELVIQSPVALGGKSLACTRYLKAFEKAKEAFKALTDNALLKAWEFTLASLSESKADFAKWNLYISLGVQPDEPDGIGQSLYEVIQEKIKQINEEITEYQSRYDHLFAQAKYLEGRIRNASTEREAGWIQAEYQIRRHEIDRALNERDTLYEKGRKLQSLYPFLINFYGEKIREYFQEVYDAEMHDVTANPYDDSPAGFRLLYKHGRSNTSLWTLINSSAEYIQDLTSFFVATEVELLQKPEVEGLQKELSELITTAIMTIKRPEFLKSSIHRLARAYGEPVLDDPLEQLEKVKRKPWAYISGGTMANLVSCYWGNPQKPSEVKRWVESENELLAFLIDSIKELPLAVQQTLKTDENKSLLAFSPTHAFLGKPGWRLFREGWESSLYTYTWIRDQWAAPQIKFLDTLLLNNRMMEAIIDQLLRIIPLGYRTVVQHALSSFGYAMTPPEFRENVMQTLSYEKWLHGGRRLELIGEELDSILYNSLPLFPEHELRERLDTLFYAVEEIDEGLRNELLRRFDEVEEQFEKYKILTAEDLRNIAKGLLIACLKKTRSSHFYHQKIMHAMQKTGLCYPEPILFADTNWVKNVFGFVVNPGTRAIDFWRFDSCASTGRPIALWKRYFNGLDKGEWGLYNSPRQYER